MELKTQKAFFTLGVNAFGKIADIIKNTDYLPQRPINHFKLLKLILDKDPKSDIANLVAEIKKDQELLKSFVGALSSKDNNNNISAENLTEALTDLEKTLFQNLVAINVAKKYSQVLKLTSNQKTHENWKIALKSSIIAVSIAKWAKMTELEMAFMGAILSEIPNVVMSINEPHSMQYIEEKMANGMPKRNAEILALGFDYVELGSKLFKYYGIPSEIIDLIQYGYEVDKVKPKNKKLASIVNFSKYIAQSFSDKSQSPSSIWMGSQRYIKDLELDISPEDWGNKISLLFVKSLEFEMSVMS